LGGPEPPETTWVTACNRLLKWLCAVLNLLRPLDQPAFTTLELGKGGFMLNDVRINVIFEAN
jgi:hypothetical protein